jgi:hypothetical protein
MNLLHIGEAGSETIVPLSSVDYIARVTTPGNPDSKTIIVHLTSGRQLRLGFEPKLMHMVYPKNWQVWSVEVYEDCEEEDVIVAAWSRAPAHQIMALTEIYSGVTAHLAVSPTLSMADADASTVLFDLDRRLATSGELDWSHDVVEVCRHALYVACLAAGFSVNKVRDPLPPWILDKPAKTTEDDAAEALKPTGTEDWY